MEKSPGVYSAEIHAIMRVIVGLLFFCHGLQKVFGLFGGVNGATVALLSLIGLAGLVELICGLLVALGWFTGYAAFLASGEMAAAFFMGHFPKGFWPIQNEGELAVLYCFIFLYISTQGSRVWGIDAAQRGHSLHW